jgi:hypothetical protein
MPEGDKEITLNIQHEKNAEDADCGQVKDELGVITAIVILKSFSLLTNM